MAEASRRGGAVLATGLEYSSSTIRQDLGYDVGDLGANAVRSAVSGPRGAYQSVESENGWRVPSMDAQEAGTGDDFFESNMGGGGTTSRYGSTANSRMGNSSYSDYVPSEAPRADPLAGLGNPEDAWAKMAPQSAARTKTTPQAKQPTASKKKDDDAWDEW